MSKINDLLAKQKELEKEIEQAMKEEREAVLEDIKEKIKMFNFTSTDFKGMFKGRVTKKQVEDYLKKQEIAKKKAKKNDGV